MHDPKATNHTNILNQSIFISKKNGPQLKSRGVIDRRHINVPLKNYLQCAASVLETAVQLFF